MKPTAYITIPLKALDLISVDGFIKRYLELCQTCQTFHEAYNVTEAEHENYFGFPRYADYYSFKSSLNYHRRKQRKARKLKAALALSPGEA